jgi:hypothetical protein
MKKDLKIPAMNSAPLPGKKPRLRRILAARIAGRRDNTRWILEDAHGHHPYTGRLVAETQHDYARVATWLLQEVKEIDRELAAIAGKIIDGERRMSKAEELLHEAEAQHGVASSTPEDSPSPHHSMSARNLRSRREERQRCLTDNAALKIRAGELMSLRYMTLKQARAAIDAWETNYELLARRYQRAWQRKDVTKSFNELPTCTAKFDWIHGDLPLLVTVIDPEARQLIKLMFQDFHPGVTTFAEEESQ